MKINIEHINALYMLQQAHKAQRLTSTQWWRTLNQCQKAICHETEKELEKHLIEGLNLLNKKAAN